MVLISFKKKKTSYKKNVGHLFWRGRTLPAFNRDWMLAIPAWPSPIFFLSEPVLHISFLFLYWQSSPCWTQAFLLIVASSWPSPFSVSSRRLFSGCASVYLCVTVADQSLCQPPASTSACRTIIIASLYCLGLAQHPHHHPTPCCLLSPSEIDPLLLLWSRSKAAAVLSCGGCTRSSLFPHLWFLVTVTVERQPLSLLCCADQASEISSFQVQGELLHPSVPVLFCRAKHVSVNPFWNLVCVDARLLCCAESLSWFSVIGVLIVIVFVSYRNYRN